MLDKIKQTFEQEFSSSPILVKSPGRVNLIGEHTDYNNGFVLPAAINRYAYYAIKPNGLNDYRFYSYDFGKNFCTQVNSLEPSSERWANYLLGVIDQMVTDGKDIPGFDCVFGGDVPIGAGMSSSAAIECGLAYALNHIYDLGYSKMEMAKIAQQAEHKYAGVKCGIMDQFASLHGKKNHVLRLDCQTLQYEPFELDMSHLSLILVNTGVKHSLASSEYNKRRAECTEGVELLKQYEPKIKSLRDVEMDLIKIHKLELTPTVWDRCTYVIEENERVLAACSALKEKDFTKFGKLMYQSHYGLKNKYEVSCSELDRLVQVAEGIDGVLGARMMGGGFGGCTINLVKNESIKEFEQSIISNYKTPEGEEPEIIECVIGEGTVLCK
ncbi:MAG: galactokinase [Bacteroidales bacterium]